MIEKDNNKFDSILKLVKKTIILTVDESEINEHTELTEIGMDSIAFISLISEIEDFYEIEFPEDKLIISNSSTIAKLIETLDYLGI